MTKSFRKTTQRLAPAIHTPNCAYNLYPGQPIEANRIELGFSALARRIALHEFVVLDGMGGVIWADFRARLTAELAELGVFFEWINVDEALLAESEVQH